MKLLFWTINIIMLFAAIIFSIGIINSSVVLLISNLLLITISVLALKRFIKLNKTFLVLYLILMTTIILASMINRDINLLVAGIYLLIFLTTFGLALPNIIHERYIITVTNIVIVIIILVVSSHMLIHGFTMSGYSAWYSNSNSLAIIATTLYTCSYSRFIYYIMNLIDKKLNLHKIITFMFCTIFGLYISLISSSRASLMTIIFITFIGVLLIIIKLTKEGKIKSLLIRFPIYMFFIALIIFSLSFVFDFFTLFEENIIGKFVKKSNADRTLFDGREHIWLTTLSEAGLFGKGDSYFEERFIIGALNTFIGILGRFGYLTAITFILIVLYVLKRAYNKFSHRLNSESVVSIFLMLNFIFLSITEVQFYGVAAVLFFMAIADVLKPINIYKGE